MEDDPKKPDWNLAFSMFALGFSIATAIATLVVLSR